MCGCSMTSEMAALASGFRLRLGRSAVADAERDEVGVPAVRPSAGDHQRGHQARVRGPAASARALSPGARPDADRAQVTADVEDQGASAPVLRSRPPSAPRRDQVRGGRDALRGVGAAARTAAGRPSPGPPARTSVSTPAAAWTGSSLRARPAPSRQAATPTAQASSRGHRPGRRCRPPPRGAGAPEGRRPGRRPGPGPSRARRPSPRRRRAQPPDRRPARQGEHLARQRHRQLDHVGRSAAGQHLDRLGHLYRISGGPAQRRRHVGQHRGRGHPVCRADGHASTGPARSPGPDRP